MVPRVCIREPFMPAISYYFAVLSPFTYLAGDHLERIAARHGVPVNYHVIDIAAVGSETGWTPPAKRHPARAAYRLQDIARLARRENLPVNLQPAFWPTDPAPASRAFNAALLAGADVGPLARAIVRAVWAEERDIADPDTLDTILTENGIDPAALAPHLQAGAARYQQDTREAPERGVFGVPFYLVDDERFWGQDRLTDLDRHLAEIS